MEQKIKDVLRQYNVSDNLIETLDKLNFHIVDIECGAGWGLYTYDNISYFNRIDLGYHAFIMEKFSDDGYYIFYCNHFQKNLSIHIKDYKNYLNVNIEQQIIKHKNFGGFTCDICKKEKNNMIYDQRYRGHIFGVCSDCHIPQEHKEDTTNYTDDYKQFLIQHKTMWNNLLKALEV